MSLDAEQLRLSIRRMGPAPLPPGVAKVRRVAVRLDGAQLRRLEGLASLEDLSMSEVMRVALLVMELALKNPTAVAAVLVDRAVQVERVVQG